MKIEKKDLNLENGLKKEWIITNGIGGYASSTVLGCNTRKYHGLLVAPLMPPARRFLILSKLDESIEMNDKKYNLYTNMCKNYIADGYKYIESFEKEFVPIYKYEIEDVKISKIISMIYGKNTVSVLYKIRNGSNKAKLTLAPILNFRDFHQENSNHEYRIKQEVRDTKVRIIIDENISTPVYMYVNSGKYIEHENDIFRNMYYIEEEKRGFYPEENHTVPGRFEIELAPQEEKDVYFICSLEENIEEIDLVNVISNEVVRIRQLLIDSKLFDAKRNTTYNRQDEDFLQNYIIATDNFIVYRPSFNLHTVIAGYHWFLDWGRDALIAFEGLLLITRRFQIAKEVLHTFLNNIKFGLVPNGYSGFDGRPLYNSADASLLLFEQVHKYIKYSGDKEFVKTIYNDLTTIIESYRTGITFDDNNIYMDDDYLISSGTEKTQNTWMDAKYGNFAVTPRNGKTVELNSLWYNALLIMRDLATVIENKKEAQKYTKIAKKVQKSFLEKFYNPRKKCLYDVLGDSKIRPNQLFSLSTTYPIIEPNSDMAYEILETVTKKLLTKYGLRTLAKGEPNYIEIYEGDSFRRDMSYHQGPVWPWLLGLYYDSLKNMIKFEKNKNKKKELEQKLEKFIQDTEKTFKCLLYQDGAMGSLSEIYDTKPPYSGKGTIAQAWSVSEVYRIILRK